MWKPKYEGSSSGRALWGSAVVSTSVDLEPHNPDDTSPWLRELGGSTAIATSDNPRWIPSFHAWDREISAERLERISVEGIR